MVRTSSKRRPKCWGNSTEIVHILPALRYRQQPVGNSLDPVCNTYNTCEKTLCRCRRKQLDISPIFSTHIYFSQCTYHLKTVLRSRCSCVKFSVMVSGGSVPLLVSPLNRIVSITTWNQRPIFLTLHVENISEA